VVSEATDGGFIKVHETEAFAAPVFAVNHLELQDPGGHEFDRFIVRHPGAVTVIPIDDAGQVTLVRQYRSAVDHLVLEAPAGTRDVGGEPPEVTARRELMEEAGLEATDMTLLTTTYNSPGISDQLTYIYLATGLRPCETARVGAEESWMSIEHINLDQLDALIADGTLMDETTVLGLFMARGLLTRQRS
jgi:8-oxo-dGTP pyrophosphatase MutT (NUDIX family)